jgi:hypothetical protein
MWLLILLFLVSPVSANECTDVGFECIPHTQRCFGYLKAFSCDSAEMACCQRVEQNDCMDAGYECIPDSSTCSGIEKALDCSTVEEKCCDQASECRRQGYLCVPAGVPCEYSHTAYDESCKESGEGDKCCGQNECQRQGFECIREGEHCSNPEDFDCGDGLQCCDTSFIVFRLFEYKNIKYISAVLGGILIIVLFGILIAFPFLRNIRYVHFIIVGVSTLVGIVFAISYWIVGDYFVIYFVTDKFDFPELYIPFFDVYGVYMIILYVMFLAFFFWDYMRLLDGEKQGYFIDVG